jgi:hypothetical protein
VRELPRYLSDYIDQYKGEADKPECTGCNADGYVKPDGPDSEDVECSICKGEGYLDFPDNLFAEPEEDFEELMVRLREVRRGRQTVATLECQIKLLHQAIAGEHNLDLDNPQSVYDWWHEFVDDYDGAPGLGTRRAKQASSAPSERNSKSCIQGSRQRRLPRSL